MRMPRVRTGPCLGAAGHAGADALPFARRIRKIGRTSDRCLYTHTAERHQGPRSIDTGGALPGAFADGTCDAVTKVMG